MSLIESKENIESIEENGGRTRARTWDPLIKSQLLYQLSYASIAVPAWPDPVGSAPGSTSPGGGQNENAALKALPESQLGSASPRPRSPAAAPRLIENGSASCRASVCPSV